jgi:hypothetical protein
VATSEAANVDLGSRFYAQQKQGGESMPTMAFGSPWQQQQEQPPLEAVTTVKRVTLEDPKSGQTFPTGQFGRSMSVHDQRAQQGTSSSNKK